MNTNPHATVDPSCRRQLAEKRFEQNRLNTPDHLPTEAEMQHIIHELSVHQIELEMQQEELLQARNELESSLKRFSDLYDFAPLGYLTLDPDGTIREINLKGAALLGRERGYLKGYPFLSFVDREHREIYDARMKTLYMSGEAASFEINLQQDDRQQRIVRIEANLSDDRSECKAVLMDVANERKVEEENAALQANLFQAQKIEAVGQLAGGIAHDFNNMLGVILGNAELAIDSLEPGSPVCDNLERIQKAATRSANLTNQLLTFARKQTISPQLIDLNQSIEAFLPMLKSLMGETIDLIYNPVESLSPIFIDPVQVEQILLNLALNSRDAIVTNGSITIETRMAHVRQSGPIAIGHYHQKTGHYAMLIFTDTGSGISEETLPHIFEPFFTTKAIGKGTGLGLAMVYGIVKQNNLDIECNSEWGKGTTITISFPVNGEPASKTIVEKEAEKKAKKGLQRTTILLVEDEPDIGTLLKNILQKNGYDVLFAENAQVAFDISAASSEQISLLLTDVMLPGMNGVELSEKMNAELPGMKTLFISGYSRDIIDSHGVFSENENFVAKPFSIKKLLAAVKRLLSD